MPPTPSAIRQSPNSTLVKVSLPSINFFTSFAVLVHPLCYQFLQISQSSQSDGLSIIPTLTSPFDGSVSGDYLRTGPLSPALLDRPAPGQATQPVAHTVLTTLLDCGGAIAPGTQALLALLSGSEENNPIHAYVAGQDSSLSNPVIGASNIPMYFGSQHPSEHSTSVAHRVGQNLRSTMSASTPASNPESLSAASHRSANPSFPSKSTMSSSSAFKGKVNLSASVNFSPSSASQTPDPVKCIYSSLCQWEESHRHHSFPCNCKPD